MTKRILTAVQCSGMLHLGNIVSVISPTVQLLSNVDNEVFVFLADLHSFTSVRDPKLIDQYRYNAAAVWMAMGLDHHKAFFYRQSRIRGICELSWILNCLAPFPMLLNAHAFKDKSDKLSDVNVGLFDYPILMCADILSIGAEYVPVGKDQLQHIEIARDIAKFFNNRYGETFTLPQPIVDGTVSVIPGIDGSKMSKSYGNTIDIFVNDDDLYKRVMSIKTDSKSAYEPKNPDTCIIFKIYSTVAGQDEVTSMRMSYLDGTMSYKNAKELLYNTILEKYRDHRRLYNEIVGNYRYIDMVLSDGERSVQSVVDGVINTVKKKLFLK